MKPSQSDSPHVEAEWFYTQHGEMYGPVSSVELRAAAQLGFLGPGDLVRRQGQREWTIARALPGLFSAVERKAPS